MNNYVTAQTIKQLRENKHYTQKQLADILLVSDKTISKWETQRGLPDITLLEPLAQALGVSVAELLNGEFAINNNKHSNLKKGSFYVCPVCQNVVYAVGNSVHSCCGINLPATICEPTDEKHIIKAERENNELYVSIEHTMTKQHYISFIAYVTQDRCNITKLYAEQTAQARFLFGGHGKIYAYCNQNGLYGIEI